MRGDGETESAPTHSIQGSPQVRSQDASYPVMVDTCAGRLHRQRARVAHKVGGGARGNKAVHRSHQLFCGGLLLLGGDGPESIVDRGLTEKHWGVRCE